MKFIFLFLFFIPALALADAVIFSGADVKALKYNLDLFGRSKVLGLNVDPRAGAGIAAPLASIGMDYLTGSVYIKTSAPDTGWVTIAGSTVGSPYTFAGYDVDGNLGSLIGWSYVDSGATSFSAVINKPVLTTATDIRVVTVRQDLDDVTASNFNGFDINSNIGSAGPATAVDYIIPFANYMTLGANLTSLGYTGYDDLTNVIGSVQNYSSYNSSPSLNGTTDFYTAIGNYAKLGNATAVNLNGVTGVGIFPNVYPTSTVADFNGVNVSPVFQSGSTLTTYTGYRNNPQIDATGITFYRGLYTGATIGQTSATAISNAGDIQAGSQFAANAAIGNYTGLVLSPQFQSGSSVSSAQMLYYNPSIEGTISSDLIGIGGIPQIGISNAVSLSSYIDANFNPAFGANLTLGSYTGVKVRANVNSGASVTGDVQLIDLGLNSSLPVAGTATGISVNMSNFVTPRMPMGLNVSNGGTNLGANFDTGLYILDNPYTFNFIGGSYKVSAGSPTTGQFGIGNNLGIVLDIQDDVVPDTSGLNLGFIMNGFLTQVQVAAGKTMDSLTFMGAGAQLPSGSGTFNDVTFYRALSLVPAGGTETINNMYGFKVDSIFSLSSPTNAWGVFVDDANIDNYFAKDVVIGGATKKPTNSSVGLEVAGTTKAILYPRLTTSERNALTAVAGMQIYNTTTSQFECYVASWSACGGNISVQALSSNTTLTIPSAYVTVDATSGNIDITLPDCVSGIFGTEFSIKKIDSSANTVTLQRTGSDDTFDGMTSYPILTQYDAIKVVCVSTTLWAIY